MRANVAVATAVSFMFAISIGAHAEEMLTVPAGQRVNVILDESIDSANNESGDRFRGRLAANVVVDGIAVARRGDDVTGRVIEARPAGRIFGKAGLAVALRQVAIEGRTYDFESVVLDLDGERSGDLKKIAVKAAVGATLGGADLAKRMAMTGTAIALITPGNQLVLPHRAVLEFHLASPVQLEALSQPLHPDIESIEERYGRAMWEMMRALQRRQWERRIEIREAGDVVFSEDARLRLAPDGEVIAEELPGSGEEPKGGIRGKLQKRKEKKMDALYGKLVELVRTYAFMPDAERASFVRNAACSPGFGGLAGSLQFDGIDVLNENDWVVMWIDVHTSAPRKIVVSAVVDEQDMALFDINFDRSPDGVLYPSSMSIVMPTRDITGTVRQGNVVPLG